jgi:hypothetical protein
LPLAELATLAPGCPGPDCTVVYGGFGGSLRLEAVIAEDLEGRVADVPIEKVGVILLGIDGLRQDVFYPEGQDDVQDPFNPPIRLDPATTPGFQDIMGGPLHNVDAHTLRLRGASAIFPSITLASWASVSSGEGSGVTGELGNEFFDRALATSPGHGAPPERQPPSGLITYSSGAFPGYDTYTTQEKQVWDFIPPGDPPPLSSRQNFLWQGPKLFEEVAALPGYAEEFGPVVVAMAHYAQGAGRWVTLSPLSVIASGVAGPLSLIECAGLGAQDEGTDCSQLIDGAGIARLITFLREHTFTLPKGAVRFPGVLKFYQMGPDHVAHYEGVGDPYRNFIRDFSGEQVLAPLKRELVALEEYYNKIFIITTDHGHTEAAGTGAREEWTLQNWNAGGPAVDLTNHHVHLDEFVALMRLVENSLSPDTVLQLRVLHPKADQRDPATRNVVVAFNGPMAHVYVRAVQADGTMLPWDVPACQEDRDTIGNGIVAALGGVQAGFGGSGDLYTDAALFELDDEPEVKPLQKLIDGIDFVLVRKGSDYVVRKPFPAPDVWPPPEAPPPPPPSRPECAGKTVPLSSVEEFTLEEWAAAWPTEYVDLADRVRAMNHAQRAGDIVVVFRSRTDEPRESRYISSGNLPSWHGSLNRSDSYVPFMVSYPGGNADQVKEFVEPVCGSTTHCESTLKVAPLIKTIVSRQLLAASEEMEQGP